MGPTSTTDPDPPGSAARRGLGVRGALAPLSGFRPDVQALRGLAVLLVVCYHAKFVVHGGYVGVDVFFVISGFVIGRRLLGRASATTGAAREKRSALVEFYVHRARRILPALAVMLVVVVVAAPFLAPVGGINQTSPTALAAALFSANIRLYRSTALGYFSPAAELNPLLHTWSLSVEEQFYFVIPVLVLVAWWLGLRRSRSLTTTRVLIASLTVVSLALCVFLTTTTRTTVWHVSPHRFSFYSPFTRAWEFGIGLALVVLPARWLPSARRRLLATLVVLAGLVAVLAASFGFSDTTAFPGAWALVPVLGTAAVIWGGTRRTADEAEAASATPSWLRPATWLGDVSYSWYLWHWPFIVFALGFWPGNDTVLVIAAAASLLPAWASYRALERPLRATATTRVRPTIVLAVVCIVAPILAIGVAKPLRAFANRQAASHFRIVAEGEIDQRGDAPDCLNDTPLPERPADACVITAASGSKPSVVLVGDSNAAMFGNALIGATRTDETGLRIVAAPGCVFADLRYRIPWGASADAVVDRCHTFVTRTVDALVADPPDVVVIAGSVDQDVYKDPLPFQGPDGEYTTDVGAKERIYVDGLTRVVRRLQAAGSRVVLLDVVPKPYALDPRECSNLAIVVDTQRCLPDPFTLASRTEMASANDLLAEVRSATGAAGWNFAAEICPNRRCVAFRDGYQVWRDPVHISAEQSQQLVPSVTDRLRSVLATPAPVVTGR